ncbi:hypothetical protein [Paraburkholderia sediminicola]|uniref:hypothetical protein n=1 Tax=Paraburkholderia sediminicola TaxID=458836 RepID=UPI0038BACC1F
MFIGKLHRLTEDRLFSVEQDADIWILDRDVATLMLRGVQPGRSNGACAISGCPVKKGEPGVSHGRAHAC